MPRAKIPKLKKQSEFAPDERPCWVIYRHEEQANFFIARLWTKDKPTTVGMMDKNVEILRNKLDKLGFKRLGQHRESAILETWI